MEKILAIGLALLDSMLLIGEEILFKEAGDTERSAPNSKRPAASRAGKILLRGGTNHEKIRKRTTEHKAEKGACKNQKLFSKKLNLNLLLCIYMVKSEKSSTGWHT